MEQGTFIFSLLLDADFSGTDLTTCTFRNHTGSAWQNSSFETKKLWRSGCALPAPMTNS